MRPYPGFKPLPKQFAVAAGIVHRAIPERGRTRCGRDLCDTVNWCEGPVTCPDCLAAPSPRAILHTTRALEN